MSISELLQPRASNLSKISLVNIAQISQKINNILSGATASFSTLGSDFVGLDVQNFYVIKEEIDGFLKRCNDIKSSFQIGEVEITALRGATGYSALLYANSIFSLIDSYLSFFNEFSALSEESLEKIEEGEKQNSNAINEEADSINSADIGDFSSAIAGGATGLAGITTSTLGGSSTPAEEKIINESENISKELNDFEKTNSTTEQQNISPSESSTQPSEQTTQDAQSAPAPEQTPDQPPASAGGSVAGALSPGTTANTFQAKSYNLSPEEYKTLCATVYAEAAEGNSYTTSDTMGVTSTILNRVEAGNWGGNTATDVVSAKGQFSGYGSQNAKFAAAMSNPDVISPEMRAAIDRTLAGERNTTGQSFSGNGTHNSFR